MRADIGLTPAASKSAFYTASQLRSVIERLGFVVTHVRGFSMRPLIWEGAHCVTIVALDGEPRVGDILAFEQIRGDRTAYILHRLVGMEQSHGTTLYTMRGDNCLSIERIRREDVIGRVTEVFRTGPWRPGHALPQKHFTTGDPLCRLYSLSLANYMHHITPYNFLK